LLPKFPPVIDLLNAHIFAATIADPRFAVGVGIAVIAGAVRGFSGFGSALIYIPLMSAVYGPRIAAVTFVVTDIATGLAFLPRVWRHAVWREILPLAASSVFAMQFGAIILQYADPVWMRWFICAMVGAVVVILASGWRYHGRPVLPATIAVGLFAGLLGGSAQIGGPPIVLYWLGSAATAAVVRANFIVYFAIFSLGSTATYAAHGLVTAQIIALALLLGPLQITAIALGWRLFFLASEKTYRRTAYVIVSMAAIVSMPLLDRWLR
jgi:uncharacterized membrane protein YfcA